MKYLFYIGIMLFTVSCKEGYVKEIECENKKVLKEVINIDTTTFDIGTKLFWSYNCDSAWLTYINQNQQKIILDSWTENPIFSIKMGYLYLQDYKKNILFERNVISGCCDLPDNIIIDKYTGKELINVGPKIWHSENKKYPLLICFDESDTLKDRVNSEFEKLIIYNLDKDKKYFYSVAQYNFFKNLKEQYLNYDVNLLESYSVERNILMLKFRKELVNEEGKYIIQTIKLDLTNYCI